MIASCLTPPQAAKRYGVSADKVRGLIRNGEIEAIDVSTRPGVGRPRYRITPEALAAFEERRRVQPTAPRVRRHRSTATIHEYIR